MSGRLRITRLECENVLALGDLKVDLGERTIVSGKNASAKTSFLRLVACMLGASGESLAALVTTDEEGVSVEGAVPRAVMFLRSEDGTEAYRVERKAKQLKVDREEGGAWRPVGPTPDQALASIFDRDSSPAALLDPKLSDDKRIQLLLDVAEAPNYQRKEALLGAGFKCPACDGQGCRAESGLTEHCAKCKDTGLSFDLEPIPAGLHPIEDLARVQAQVFNARTGVTSALKAALSAAERLEVGLPAEAPEDAAAEINQRQIELYGMVGDLNRAEAGAKATRDAALAAAQASLRAAEERSQGVAAGMRGKIEADLDRRIAQARAELERQIGEWKDEAAAKGLDIAQEAERQAASAGREAQLATEAAHSAHDAALAALQAQREELLAQSGALATLRAQQEHAVADRARRQEAEKARAEAAALSERAAALTQAIDKLKLQAAGYVEASFPGVRIEVEDTPGGKPKRVVMVNTDNGWKPWGFANEARLAEIAGKWSILHQAQHQRGDQAQLAIVILDHGERLDDEHRTAAMRSWSEHGQVLLAVRTNDAELKVESA